MSTVITSSTQLFSQQHINNVVLLLDENFHVIEANKTAQKFFSNTTEKLSAYSIWQLFKDRNFPLIYTEQYAAQLKNYPILAQQHMLDEQHGIIWHLITNPTNNEEYIFVAQPFENNKDDLKIQQLIQAKISAEKGNQAKLNFLTNMSHELRNSLNGLLGMAQILSMRNLPADTQDYVKDIYQSGSLILSLVNDMLDFAKLEAGQLTFKQEPFNLRKLSNDVLANLRKQCETRQLDLILDYCDSVPRLVIGDANRLRQVIINLVNNSIKFTHTGHVLVAVDLIKQYNNQITLQIIIEDTGIGIPQEKLKYIFDRFVQIPNQSYTSLHKGTGLGLAIVKQIIEKMGGQITVNSVEGKGATFWIKLPLKLQKNSQLETHSLMSQYENLRVLIIDNNSRRGIVLAKQVFGNSSTSVNELSAPSTLKSASESGHPFKIIIFDDQLDDFHGLVKSINNDPGIDDSMNCILSKHKNKGLHPELFFHEIIKPPNPAFFNKDLTITWERWLLDHKLKAEAKTIKHRKPVILLVEDNIMNQKVASIMFQEIGCDVTVAASGEETLSKLDLKYDIIFLDIGLPDMDGCELAKRITKLSLNQDTPLIALTAHALECDRQRFIDAGMKEVLTKPITFSSAQAIVSSWFQ